MSRFLLPVLFLLLFIEKSVAQANKLPQSGPAFYFNQFQHFNDTNADSSLHYLHLLAGNTDYAATLQDLFHNIFAQAFLPRADQELTDSTEKAAYLIRLKTGHAIINSIMNDTNQVLIETARPLYLWIQVMRHRENNPELNRLIHEYMRTVLTRNVYTNRVGRYALLIYAETSGIAPLQTLADELLQAVYQKLKNGPVKINKDSATRTQLRERAWYRYHFAYTNVLMGRQAMLKSNGPAAGSYFKAAFDFSPDLTDKNNFNAVFYDMHFLLGKDKRGFEEEYLDYLTNKGGDREPTLETLLAMSLTNPEFKDQLQQYYTTYFSKRGEFGQYWISAVNRSARPAPVISLTETDGSVFSSASFKGKWILVDFWGTWCSPCRAEHPDLDSFYQSVIAKYPEKIRLLTVACKDDVEKVKAYMEQFHYRFPVAMAGQTIERDYNVQGYPYKVLISPAGRYVVVPFGSDWINFVKKYAEL